VASLTARRFIRYFGRSIFEFYAELAPHFDILAQRVIFQIEMWELVWQLFLTVVEILGSQSCFPGKHVLAGEIWLCNEDEVELFIWLIKFYKK